MPDGSLNVYDEAPCAANGKLSAIFDTSAIHLDPFSLTVIVDSRLYQIDPLTGKATVIGPTIQRLGAATQANGAVYALANPTARLSPLT